MAKIESAFETYIAEINKAYQRGDATEHTHRPALKNLIESINDKITAINEPKRIDCGAPDLLVTFKKRTIEQSIGYIECKDIGINLNQTEKDEQIKKRYLTSLENLILTDYTEFRLYVNGEKKLSVKLAEETGGKFRITLTGIEQVSQLFNAFLEHEPLKIGNAKELTQKMGDIAKLLRDIINSAFKQEGKSETLHGQYEAFKEVLIHDLTEEQFADMYSQTICYGLFSARCHMPDTFLYGKDNHAPFHGMDEKRKLFTRESAAYLLPKTNPFLRKTFGHIAGPELDDRIAWLVDDLVALLRNTDMGSVLKDFSKKTNRKDPVFHFYETFLAEYDSKLKKSRGVYYTPDEVVSYIVRSVDILLKEKFGLQRGLADNSKIKINSPATGAGAKHEQNGEVHRCLILDPAVGTGTFLYEVIEQIYGKFKNNKGMWSDYVREHLLPRIFGFELMMAPYSICHMKLGLQLAETGYDFATDERLGVYLTNTLEEANEISKNMFAQWITEEARAANKVKKDLPIMVVLGNPPYAGNSANKNWEMDGDKKIPNFIGRILKDYYLCDGEPLGERNPKWLQDDYVKFIRFGQYRIEQTGSGILAFITNHGYLDNPTFRGMRQSLMQTFDEIYVLDLHGNYKKMETCPDGSKDVNVFDIQQGVSIGIFVKGTNKQREHKIYHSDIYGIRKDKYQQLLKDDINTTKWKELKPSKPFYLFASQNTKLLKKYNEFWKITDGMKTNVLGFQTHRDDFAIDFDYKMLLKRINEMRDNTVSDQDYMVKYDLKDNRDWKFNAVRNLVRNDNNWKSYFQKCSYRPFDVRFCYFNEIAMDYPRKELKEHVAGKGNICLGLGRQGIAVNDPEWSLISISNEPIDANIFRRGGINVFPLYLYPTEKKKDLFEHSDWPEGKDGRVPNLDKGFVEELAGKIDLKFVSDGRGNLGEKSEKGLKSINGVDSRLRGNDTPAIHRISATAPTGAGAKRDVGTFGPEDVLAYIYGIFHSPEYRKRYAEFLKIDFPRVPMPADKESFVKICRVGQELMALHLLEAKILEDEKQWPRFGVKGSSVVEKGYPSYVKKDGEKGRVYINQEQYFEGVEPEVWEFCIGGYQVCEKWLKDRRERTLSYDEQNHYQKIVVALRETSRLMQEKCLKEFFEN